MYNCVTCKDTCNMSKQELFSQIQALAFAINDLALYLDTHVHDRKALDMQENIENAMMNMKENMDHFQFSVLAIAGDG